jgi:hypothetical protein
MNPNKSRTSTIVDRYLHVSTGLNGVLAFIFGPVLIFAPHIIGIDILIAEMSTWPMASIFFQSLLWPGIALSSVVGLPNLLAFIALRKKQQSAGNLAIAAGILTFLFTLWQLIFMFNPLAVIYMTVGICQATAGIHLRKAQALL